MSAVCVNQRNTDVIQTGAAVSVTQGKNVFAVRQKEYNLLRKSP